MSSGTNWVWNECSVPRPYEMLSQNNRVAVYSFV